MKKWILGLLLFFTVGVNAGHAETQKILLVHEGYYSFNQLAQHLRSSGYIVDMVNVDSPTITVPLLSKYNQMWFFGSNPYGHRIFQKSEVDAVISFQKSGGSLLMAGDHKARPGQPCRYPGDYNQNLNLIAQEYGVACSGCIYNPSVTYAPWTLFAPETSSHDIWSEVSQILAHDSECEMTVNDSKVDVIGRMKNSLPVLAVRQGCAPEGKIVFDSTFVRYVDGLLGSGDQSKYALNIAAWLSTNNRCNSAPHANAGSDQTLELQSCDGVGVVLDGSGSIDPDADPLSYRWSWNGGSAEGKIASVVLPLGVHEITLTVSDPDGLISEDKVLVKVADTIAPTLDVAVDRSLLWPPNHRLIPVNVSTKVTDACVESTRVELVSVISSEPVNGIGNGNTNTDIIVSGSGTVMLRAERSGAGDGRTYTILYSATDIAGNTTYSSAMVEVPHSR